MRFWIRFLKSVTIALAGALAMGPHFAHADATHFSGGLCASQGTWLQSALDQADTITSAVNVLRNDPNCKALVNAVDSSKPTMDKEGNSALLASKSSFASSYRELSALSGSMRSAQGTNNFSLSQLKTVLYPLVLTKSFNVVSALGFNPDDDANKDPQKISQAPVDVFISHAKDIANSSMKTSQSILAALPASELCFKDKPDQANLILSAAVNTAASLVSGGDVNGIGSFLASIINYRREMKFVDATKPMEFERFNASVSCLVETTSEAYCSLQDAEDSLNFIKGVDENGKRLIKDAVDNTTHDPLKNSLGGMIILMRDVPVVVGWMQKILFGVDPKLDLEAQMKNSYWDSYISFIKSVNTLKAGFRDREVQFKDGGATRTREAGLSQIKLMIDFLAGSIGNSSNSGPMGGGGINFFERSTTINVIAFTLMGQPPPADWSANNPFDVIWQRWVAANDKGTSDPDKLMETIKTQLWALMDKATNEANRFFSARMIVDPQNLITEATKGPGISPYQAFIHIRSYLKNLKLKLEDSIAKLTDPAQAVRRKQLKSQLPQIVDSIDRLNEIIGALDGIADMDLKKTRNDMAAANNNVMDLIYSLAKMNVSRDSFFSTRLQTLLQADISDTLWTQKELTPAQSELFMNLGSSIVAQLSRYFAPDLVTQRADISQAKVINIQNLKSVEGLFAKVLFQQIIKLTCDLEGGRICREVGRDLDPAKPGTDPDRGFLETVLMGKGIATVTAANAALKADHTGSWFTQTLKELIGIAPYHNTSVSLKKTEDSSAVRYLKSKLCIQSLAFESRGQFYEMCKGSVLLSEFSDEKDDKHLNSNYNELYNQLETLKASSDSGKIESSRRAGVCALRGYIRRNHIFQMYSDYTSHLAD